MLGQIGGLLSSLFGGSSGSSGSFSSTTKSTTNASSKDLSDPLLKSLETLFQGQVGGSGFADSAGAVSGRLKQLVDQSKAPQFDVAGFAKGITDAATSGAQIDLESGINGMLSKSGITESGNSMGALLASKLRNQTAATLGGISAQATATGEQIRQAQQGQLTEGINTSASTILKSILDLISGTRGADTTGTSTTNSKTSGTESSKTKGGLLGLF